MVSKNLPFILGLLVWLPLSASNGIDISLGHASFLNVYQFSWPHCWGPFSLRPWLAFCFFIIDEINCKLLTTYLETCLRVSVLSITNGGAMYSLHYPWDSFFLLRTILLHLKLNIYHCYTLNNGTENQKALWFVLLLLRCWRNPKVVRILCRLELPEFSFLFYLN